MTGPGALGTPPASYRKARLGRRDSMGEVLTPDGASPTHGVSVFWLAKWFGMDVAKVRKRLAGCPPVSARGGGYLYRLVDAAPYLCQPRIDLAGYLESINGKDLPVHLQPTFYEAKLRRQKYELQARQLWRAEDVVASFSEIWKIIKFSLQLWPDALERSTHLSKDQREELLAMCDALQDEIYREVRKWSAENHTPNSLARDNEDEEAASKKNFFGDEVEEDGDPFDVL